MKFVSLAFIFVSLAMSVVCFLTTNNMIFSIVLFVIYIAYYFLILRKKFKSYYSLTSRVHSCYHFINSFIITLSVKESFDDAFQSGIRIPDKILNEQAKGIEDLNIYDKVKYLRGYFKLSIYKMFLNVLDLYQDQGGNILNMSDNLIRECTRTEKTLTETKQIGYKHLIDFVILWLMSTAILLFLRYGISDFYMKMLQDNVFSILIFAYFIIFLVSVHLFFTAFTNLSIKEDNEAWN